MLFRRKIEMLLPMIILMIACNPQTRLQTLSFFFDGVPVPANDSLIESSNSGQLVQLENHDSSFVTIQEKYAYHEPYQEKNCTACHDRNDIGSLVQTEPDLCYSCHQDFNEKYEMLHGPVDAGFCSACHHPHMSLDPYLLSAPGNELCSSCHIEEEVQQPPEHVDIGTSLCITCHNPHGKDEQERILKRIPLER